MGNFSFEKDVYVVKCNNFMTGTNAADRIPASVSFIDMKGIDHGVFLVGVGTEDTAATFQVYQDTSATETVSIKVVTSASQLIAADDDDKWFSIEFDAEAIDRANSFRYVTLVTSAGTGNDYYCVFFLGFKTRSSPVTQAAGYAYHVAI
jgi:hypothetical protein